MDNLVKFSRGLNHLKLSVIFCSGRVPEQQWDDGLGPLESRGEIADHSGVEKGRAPPTHRVQQGPVSEQTRHTIGFFCYTAQII